MNIVLVHSSIQHACANPSTKTRRSDRVPPSPPPSKSKLPQPPPSNFSPCQSAGITGLQTALALQAANYIVTIIAEHVPGDENPLYTSPWYGNHPFPCLIPTFSFFFPPLFLSPIYIYIIRSNFCVGGGSREVEEKRERWVAC